MKEKFRDIFTLVKRSVKKYGKDDPLKLAGTTAYFTVFTMAPIIIIIVSITGFIIGQENIQDKLFVELNQLIGEKGTQYVQTLVDNYKGTEKSIIGTIVGFLAFIFISTTFFKVMQTSLNYIWRIKAKPNHNFLKSLKDRLLSLGLIVSLGFVLLVSLVIDAAASIFRDFLESILPAFTVVLIEIGNYVLTYAIITLIFALIYKFLPDARIKWKVTWIGALITAFLFMIGRLLIGLVLGNTDISVMYGAAGSLVIILLWVFYSSIIFFFGAEITQQYAEMFSENIVPKENAVRFKIKELESNS